MTEKWITWRRTSHSRHGDEITTTRLESEAKPKYSHDSRPATPEEIAAEKQRRADRDREQAIRETFEARPEYVHAKAIHDFLEWMNPEDHPLDALSVEEWAELRKKLEKPGRD